MLWNVKSILHLGGKGGADGKYTRMARNRSPAGTAFEYMYLGVAEYYILAIENEYIRVNCASSPIITKSQMVSIGANFDQDTRNSDAFLSHLPKHLIVAD